MHTHTTAQRGRCSVGMPAPACLYLLHAFKERLKGRGGNLPLFQQAWGLQRSNTQLKKRCFRGRWRVAKLSQVLCQNDCWTPSGLCEVRCRECSVRAAAKQSSQAGVQDSLSQSLLSSPSTAAKRCHGLPMERPVLLPVRYHVADLSPPSLLTILQGVFSSVSRIKHKAPAKTNSRSTIPCPSSWTSLVNWGHWGLMPGHPEGTLAPRAGGSTKEQREVACYSWRSCLKWAVEAVEENLNWFCYSCNKGVALPQTVPMQWPELVIEHPIL